MFFLYGGANSAILKML